MATSTVLPPLTATFSGVYPQSTITANVPVISANQVRASVTVKLSPIDVLLADQFAPTVDIGGEYGTAPDTVTIASTDVALYDGTEFYYIFTGSGDVEVAVAQALDWTTAIAAAVGTAITDMRALDAAITLPPGATITTV